jgi:fructose-1,6-bisphosphatase
MHRQIVFIKITARYSNFDILAQFFWIVMSPLRCFCLFFGYNKKADAILRERFAAAMTERKRLVTFNKKVHPQA